MNISDFDVLDESTMLGLGDSKQLLQLIPDDSVDSIVTDPPYGINFM